MRCFVCCFVVVVACSAVSSCAPCRRIETRALPLDCEPAAPFTGELHFDSADTFESFLTDRCLPSADDAAIGDLVTSVDFSTEAVFVARGVRAGELRCIEERTAESVNVCDEGLRIVFADVESGNDSCGGLWTVAFALPRGELKAAIDDGDNVPTF